MSKLLKYVGVSRGGVEVDPAVGDYRFPYNEPVEVPDDIADRFVDREDFEVVKESRPVRKEND